MSINYTPDNTFIFTFVRMNPPTPGHLLLIKNLIDKALQVGSEKAYIITSSSMDGKNPLPCSRETLPNPKKITKADSAIIDQMLTSDLVYKSYILEEMIRAYKRQLIECEQVEEAAEPTESSTPESVSIEDTSKKGCIGDSCTIVGGGRREQIEKLNVIILCSTGSPFGFINSIIRNDFIDREIPKINMFFIVGRDRAPFLDTIVDYYRKTDFISSIDGEVLDREGMNELKISGPGECSIEDIDPSAYSASFVRGLVKNGKKKEFNQVYNKFLSAENIQKMFDMIQIGTQLKIPSSKDEDENPESRYFDGKLFPLIIKSGGRGRRRKTRKKQSAGKKQKTYRKKRTYKKRKTRKIKSRKSRKN